MTLRERAVATRGGAAPTGRTIDDIIDLREVAGPDDLVEVPVLIRPAQQEALELLAGNLGASGRSALVEVTFRREARIGHGRVRVEILGRTVAEVESQHGELLAAALRHHDGPPLVGSGLIVAFVDGSGTACALRVWAPAQQLQQMLHPA